MIDYTRYLTKLDYVGIIIMIAIFLFSLFSIIITDRNKTEYFTPEMKDIIYTDYIPDSLKTYYSDNFYETY